MNENQTERVRAMKITVNAIKRGAAGLLLGAALVLLWEWARCGFSMWTERTSQGTAI